MRQQFSFVKRINDEVTEDCFPKLKLVASNDPKTHYSVVECEALEPGDYSLQALGSNPFSMSVTVHKGQIWNNVENFI